MAVERWSRSAFTQSMCSVDEMNKCAAETSIRTARCRSRYHRQFCIAHALPYIGVGNVLACWRELCEGAGEEETKQEKNNGFKRWFLRLGEALTRRGVEGVNAHLGTPERVAPRACRRRPATSSHSRRTSTTRSTLWCRRRPWCSRTIRCPTALASTSARRARALAALPGPSPRWAARAGGWRRWPSGDAQRQRDRGHGAAAVHGLRDVLLSCDEAGPRRRRRSASTDDCPAPLCLSLSLRWSAAAAVRCGRATAVTAARPTCFRRA
jgi:hypothetical protein